MEIVGSWRKNKGNKRRETHRKTQKDKEKPL